MLHHTTQHHTIKATTNLFSKKVSFQLLYDHRRQATCLIFHHSGTYLISGNCLPFSSSKAVAGRQAGGPGQASPGQLMASSSPFGSAAFVFLRFFF